MINAHSASQPRPENGGFDKKSHIVFLCLCLGVLIAGAVLREPKPGGNVLSAGAFPLPPLCMLKRTTGMDCPGCGLTRSVVAFMHGNVQGSYHWHRVGPLVVIYLILQALRHGVCLAWSGARASMNRWGPYLDRALFILIALLPIHWLLNFLDKT